MRKVHLSSWLVHCSLSYACCSELWLDQKMSHCSLTLHGSSCSLEWCFCNILRGSFWVIFAIGMLSHSLMLCFQLSSCTVYLCINRCPPPSFVRGWSITTKHIVTASYVFQSCIGYIFTWKRSFFVSVLAQPTLNWRNQPSIASRKVQV